MLSELSVLSEAGGENIAPRRRKGREGESEDMLSELSVLSEAGGENIAPRRRKGREGETLCMR
jgi:ribosomal protein L34